MSSVLLVDPAPALASAPPGARTSAWRRLAPVALALAVAAAAFVACEATGAGATGRALAFAVAAVVAAVAGAVAAARGAGAATFEREVGGGIDHIMIGAAQTAYFVDTVSRKVAQDVRAAD